MTVRETVNQFVRKNLKEPALRKIRNDAYGKGCVDRMAAGRIIRTLEVPDMLDFEPYLRGECSLADLKKRGVNTELVKRAKVKRTTKDGAEHIEAEVELFDRSGDEFDRLMDHTTPRPKQELDVTSGGEKINEQTIAFDFDAFKDAFRRANGGGSAAADGTG